MNSEVELKIVRIDKNLPVPSYMSEGAVGIDLFSAKTYSLDPGQIKLFPTGIKVAVPSGYELQIRPRSGLAKKGLGIVNSPGTVDNDYRGEIKVCLINFGKHPFPVNRGDRIAQAVLSPVVRPRVVCVDSLDETVRGRKGFGSTGR